MLGESLKILIPVLTLIVVLLVLAKLFVFGEGPEDARMDSVSNTNSKTSGSVPIPNSGGPMTHMNHSLQKWIDVAWMETNWIGRIKLAYWDADSAVRDFLRKRGWNC